MTEKRFIPIFDGTDKRVVGAKDNGKIISFMDMFDLLNDLSEENEQLKQNLRMVEKRADKVYEENEQLKKDATTLIYANQDYRQQNQNLQKQLDYIQNSITNAIKHQKTELGQKALQEIIQDYNEWMLGHKEAKE